jgi:hypothetical protein
VLCKQSGEAFRLAAAFKPAQDRMDRSGGLSQPTSCDGTGSKWAPSGFVFGFVSKEGPYSF